MKNNSKFKNCLRRVKAIRLGQIWNLVVKCVNVGWKVSLVLIGCLLISEMISDLSWHLRNGKWVTGSRPLSDNVYVYEYSDGSARIYDKTGDKCILKGLNWVSGVPKRDSLTVFCDADGKRGFLNINTGKVVIPAKYYHAWHFSQGMAAVVDDSGRLGFIDHEGKVVIPMRFDYDENDDEECEYVFIDGHCRIKDIEKQKWGILNLSGEYVLPCDYDRLSYSESHSSWIIRKDGKEGLLDKDLKEIFPMVYDRIYFAENEGEAYLIKDGVQQLTAYDGTVIEPFVIYDTRPLLYNEYDAELEENIRIQHSYLVRYQIASGRYGVMDSRTGKVMVPALYTHVSLISKDLIRAEMEWSDNALVFTADGRKIE